MAFTTQEIVLFSKEEKNAIKQDIIDSFNGASATPIASLSVLQSTYPNGANGIYVALDSGLWYGWNGSSWVSGGTYISSDAMGNKPSYDTTKGSGTDTIVQLHPGNNTQDNLYPNILNIHPSKIIGSSPINIFDKTKDIKLNKMMFIYNGELIIQEESGWFVSGYIEVDPLTDYYVKATGVPNFSSVIFFDNAKKPLYEYRVGNAWDIVGKITTTSDVKYILISDTIASLENSTCVFANKTDNNVYTNYNEFEISGLRLEDDTIEINKLKGIRNIFNNEDGDILKNKHLFMYGGDIGYGEIPGFNVSGWIEVYSGQKIFVDSAMPTNINSIGYYDENKKGIMTSSVSVNWATVGVVTIPDGIHFIRICYNNTVDKIAVYNNGAKPLEYLPYGVVLLENIKIADSPKILTIKQDGTGNYTTLKSCLDSITDNSSDNQYMIEIYSGLYNALDGYTQEDINRSNFYGITIGDGITLKGKGDVTIGIDISSQPYDARTRISTLNVWGNFKLENLKINSLGGRYAIHDDYRFFNLPIGEYVGYIENCSFTQSSEINDISYGQGLASGEKRYFKNCTFGAFSTHNTNYSEKPSYVLLDNCIAQNYINTWDVGSGNADVLELIGCTYQSIIMTYKADSTSHNHYKLIGHGNSKAPINHAQDKFTYEFTNEVAISKNTTSSIITKGTVVMKNGTFGISPLTNNNKPLFFGVALEDIAPNEYGHIKFNGYLKLNDTALNSIVLNIGDKIGVLDGQLVVTTGDNYIGVCEIDGYIKLLNR